MNVITQREMMRGSLVLIVQPHVNEWLMCTNAILIPFCRARHSVLSLWIWALWAFNLGIFYMRTNARAWTQTTCQCLVKEQRTCHTSVCLSVSLSETHVTYWVPAARFFPMSGIPEQVVPGECESGAGQKWVWGWLGRRGVQCTGLVGAKVCMDDWMHVSLRLFRLLVKCCGCMYSRTERH